MKVEAITEAEKEAKLFLEAVKVLKQTEDFKGGWIGGCKKSSAVRRASMNLTRALADMRKP